MVVRHPGEGDRITLAFGAMTKTVKDYEREWPCLFFKLFPLSLFHHASFAPPRIFSAPFA